MTVVEPMRPDRDLNAVVELEQASFANPWTREMFTWELEYSDISNFYVLRTAHHAVAAYCSFWLVFGELHLNNLAVRPECRRRGLARTLLGHVLKEATTRGARRVTLEVRPSNDAARRLYAAAGFRLAGTRLNYYTNPCEDALILWRDPLREETAG